MKINIHKILCFILFFSILSMSFFTPFFSTPAVAAYSPLTQRFGAWVAAAISALTINLQAITATPVDMVNYIADPLNIAYTYSDQYLNDYFNHSVIQIVPEGTIIDGVTYDDVWLSSDAAEIFRTNAFDFVTANNIASNTNATFASGAGYLNDLPAYTVDGVTRTQAITLNSSSSSDISWYEYGTSQFGVQKYNDTTTQVKYKYNDQTYTIERIANSNFPVNFWIQAGNPDSASANSIRIKCDHVSTTHTSPGTWVKDPFQFDYVSGTIPSNTPLEDDQGLVIHIPPQPSGSSWQQFKQDNPEFSQPGGVQIDPTIDPDINNKLGSLADIIAPIIPVINAEFGDFSPSPVEQTTIADTNYSILESALNRINHAIETISNSLSDLKDVILEDIEIGPIKVFDKALDLITSIFSPVFTLIRSGLSIWSYVVTWLSSISAPLSFILSCLSSTPIILYPVYALVAGVLCIAIFRRFGH